MRSSSDPRCAASSKPRSSLWLTTALFLGVGDVGEATAVVLFRVPVVGEVAAEVVALALVLESLRVVEESVRFLERSCSGTKEAEDGDGLSFIFFFSSWN